MVATTSEVSLVFFTWVLPDSCLADPRGEDGSRTGGGRVRPDCSGKDATRSLKRERTNQISPQSRIRWSKNTHQNTQILTREAAKNSNRNRKQHRENQPRTAPTNQTKNRDANTNEPKAALPDQKPRTPRNPTTRNPPRFPPQDPAPRKNPEEVSCSSPLLLPVAVSPAAAAMLAERECAPRVYLQVGAAYESGRDAAPGSSCLARLASPAAARRRLGGRGRKAKALRP